jgi:hypothetical protein
MRTAGRLQTCSQYHISRAAEVNFVGPEGLPHFEAINRVVSKDAVSIKGGSPWLVESVAFRLAELVELGSDIKEAIILP